ncbi:MAG: hypothetical protein V7K98_14370 [Nostoc sp.]|uniref:hypothetical protein n=1 Tax=Nostoc sp. TaxID=1180 RepID=UPI002FF4997C
MNEQRQQAYLNLIERLLNCGSDDEVREILAANQDLIDAGLVQKMLEMANNLLRQGELDQANRLMNIAGQQLGVSSKLSSTATQKEYLDFLEQVLKVTADTRGNAQVIYPMLAKNTDRLDGVLAKILRRWGTNRLREAQADEAEHFNQVYSRIVEVCRELNKITEAIEYVERSKTRNLVEQILERDSKTIFPPEVFTQLEKYRDEIAVGQYQIQNGKAETSEVLAQHLQELRQQRNELQNQYLLIGHGFKFDSFQDSLDEHTAIIEWYILNDKILAFIVTKQGEVTVCQSQPEDREALYDWGNQYLQNYYNQNDQWLNNLGESLKELASILHIDEILNQIPKHCNQLILGLSKK